ncbi:MAG: hypothetical protein R3321_07355, partial [Nitrososphaeraceae archaeon]|nr:hypothetical protein [Nitrososphaeraceae archaeon]
DHTNKRIIENNFSDMPKANFPYLGGEERFFDKLLNYQYKSQEDFRFSMNTKVVFKIESDELKENLKISIYRIEGDRAFVNKVKNLLQKIENDYLFELSEEPEKALYLHILTKRNAENKYEVENRFEFFLSSDEIIF